MTLFEISKGCYQAYPFFVPSLKPWCHFILEANGEVSIYVMDAGGLKAWKENRDLRYYVGSSKKKEHDEETLLPASGEYNLLIINEEDRGVTGCFKGYVQGYVGGGGCLSVILLSIIIFLLI